MTDRREGRRRIRTFARFATVAAVVVVVLGAWPSGVGGVDVGPRPDGVGGGPLAAAQVETPTPPATNGTTTPAGFHVEAVSVNQSTVLVGEPVSITADVVNPNATLTTRRVRLRVFGEVVDARTVTVPARGTRQLSFVRRIAAPGSYEARVDEASVNFTVVAAETAEAAGTRTGTTSQEAPGFTALAAVVGLLLLALLARRRKS